MFTYLTLSFLVHVRDVSVISPSLYSLYFSFPLTLVYRVQVKGGRGTRRYTNTSESLGVTEVDILPSIIIVNEIS